MGVTAKLAGVGLCWGDVCPAAQGGGLLESIRL